MKIYHELSEFKPLAAAAVTTGTFDGVHVGHLKILEQLCRAARSIEGESVLLTFDPHPRQVLQPDLEMKLLQTQAEKIEELSKTGLDHLIIHPFTKDFSRTTSLDFVRNILVEGIGAKKLVIGHDHHFGRNREGSFEHLREFGPLYGFEVEEISAQDVHDITVSSTKIRQALQEGRIEEANEYLGYVYKLSGEVIHGEKIGQELGYPTANVQPQSPHKLIPAHGVYAVFVRDAAGTLHKGMCNIGNRPTFNGKQRTIEVNLLDFKGDLYGQELQLYFVRFLREELKFDSREALIEQMRQDEVDTRSLLD